MENDLAILLPVIFIMVILSGFFSGSETGLTGASKARLHKLASEGNKRAKLVLRLREDKDSLIGAILIGNNVINIAASMMAAGVAATIFGDDGFGIIIATIVMTLLILIFGEVMPKTYAFKNADKVAIFVAPLLNILVKILNPLTKFVQAISNFLLRLIGLREKDDDMDGVDALRGAIEMHHDEGAVVKDDRDMLGSILDLSHIEIHEIMAHRKDMTTINIDDDPKEIVTQAVNSSHSRLPVWQETEENIIGILHSKDVLKLDRDNPQKEEVEKLLHEPQFVPETTSLRDQLEAFREKRNHLAIVVDEYGALEGLVTLEDILEEIVGQIDDEHDKVIKGVKKRKKGGYTVRGNLSLRDLNREMDWNLPYEEDASTVAGFVIRIAERIPDIGERFEYENLRFKVLGKVRNQITSIKVKELPKDEPTE